MKYSINFKDNILPSDFNFVVEGINNWIEENKSIYDWANAPNAYEMTNVFLFAGKYLEQGHGINLEQINRMWKLRVGDFERCKISENHFVFQICKQCYESAMGERPLVSDENSHSALRKMAGVGLYLMQQKRDNSRVEYNNLPELLELIENSKAFKSKYPRLHEMFRFDDNIRVLCDLQQEHLNEENISRLDDAYTAYSKGVENRSKKGIEFKE